MEKDERRTIDEITGFLSEEALLEQVVEECGELVQAAAKRLRILRDENYTPVSLVQNFEGLCEECVDVRLAVDSLLAKVDADGRRLSELRSFKTERWANRIRGHLKRKSQN